MDELRGRLEAALAGMYTFQRELGGGGMSRTYLAVEQALNRRVVVKVLAPELLAGISVERFRREVLLAAQLQHPHVVPVLTAGDAGGLPWFSMPYVDGDSLRHRLERGPLATGEVDQHPARRRAGAGLRPRPRHRSPRHQAGQRAALRAAARPSPTSASPRPSAPPAPTAAAATPR